MRITASLLIFILLPVLAYSRILPLPLNLTASAPLAFLHNITTRPSSTYPWECFTSPNPRIQPTTLEACLGIARALNELDPTGLEDFLFSPRSVADIRLPFYLRWDNCVLDLRGIEADSWDVFPIRLLSEAVVYLARTCVESSEHLGGWGKLGFRGRLVMGLAGIGHLEAREE